MGSSLDLTATLCSLGPARKAGGAVCTEAPLSCHPGRVSSRRKITQSLGPQPSVPCHRLGRFTRMAVAGSKGQQRWEASWPGSKLPVGGEGLTARPGGRGPGWGLLGSVLPTRLNVSSRPLSWDVAVGCALWPRPPPGLFAGPLWPSPHCRRAWPHNLILHSRTSLVLLLAVSGLSTAQKSQGPAPLLCPPAAQTQTSPCACPRLGAVHSEKSRARPRQCDSEPSWARSV